MRCDAKAIEYEIESKNEDLDLALSVKMSLRRVTDMSRETGLPVILPSRGKSSSYPMPIKAIIILIIIIVVFGMQLNLNGTFNFQSGSREILYFEVDLFLHREVCII